MLTIDDKTISIREWITEVSIGEVFDALNELCDLEELRTLRDYISIEIENELPPASQAHVLEAGNVVDVYDGEGYLEGAAILVEKLGRYDAGPATYGAERWSVRFSDSDELHSRWVARLYLHKARG